MDKRCHYLIEEVGTVERVNSCEQPVFYHLKAAYDILLYAGAGEFLFDTMKEENIPICCSRSQSHYWHSWKVVPECT